MIMKTLHKIHITTRLVKQGFRYSKLCKMFKMCSHKYESIFKSFGASVQQRKGWDLSTIVYNVVLFWIVHFQ